MLIRRGCAPRALQAVRGRMQTTNDSLDRCVERAFSLWLSGRSAIEGKGLTMPRDAHRDGFGIAKLHADGGPVWNSAWHVGGPRQFTRRMRDPQDPTGFFELRGSGPVLEIDGAGIAWMSGVNPRMYVNDPDPAGAKWKNVEITFYANRVAETEHDDHQGFVAAARSEHQDATTSNPCSGTGYYGRMLYNGSANFQKELAHFADKPGLGYTLPLPADGRIEWETPDNSIPRNRWIGYKLVIRNDAQNSKILLELFRDLTDGADGGTWEPCVAVEDAGDWEVGDVRDCPRARNEMLLHPATSVFIRNTKIARVGYKKFSVREIRAEM